MKSVYERTNLIEFDTDDVIATSEDTPVVPEPVSVKYEKENKYGSFNSYGAPKNWF